MALSTRGEVKKQSRSFLSSSIFGLLMFSTSLRGKSLEVGQQSPTRTLESNIYTGKRFRETTFLSQKSSWTYRDRIRADYSLPLFLGASTKPLAGSTKSKRNVDTL